MSCHFVQLQTTTNYSYLRGASHPKELVEEAERLGYSAIAITDDDSLAGIAKAHVAARNSRVQLIVGARLNLQNAPRLLVWVQNRTGYAHLCQLLTRGRRRAPKGECHLTLEDVCQLAKGMVFGILPSGSSPKQIAAAAPVLRATGQPVYLGVSLPKGTNDRRTLNRLIQVGSDCHLPLVLAPDVRFHQHNRKALHDVMTAIRLGTSVEWVAGEGQHQWGESLATNAEGHLQPIAQRQEQNQPIPNGYATMLEIAQQCEFSLEELRYDYPTELAPADQSPMDYLRQQTWRGAQVRYPDGVPDKVRNVLERELELIEDLRYEAYFLTVYDIVNYARSQNILCQGRGSAANSAVCYCLQVTSVDPATSDLLFERFVSRERNEPPDIDIDFEHFRREEVLQYIYDKYGRSRAAMTGVNICYCVRSAIRDVGKALDFSPDRIDALAKQVDRYHSDPDLPLRCQQVGIDPSSTTGRQLIYFVNQLIGHPRHLSQHPGGMVLSQTPLEELIPIENATMPDRSVIQWDKYDLDELGILKVDCLGLGIMTAIHKSFDLLKQHLNVELDLASVPPDDSATYDMICDADTVGVFQIESRAQMATLPRLLPRCFYDLVIEIALIRPGPIQGNMVHPLLRRRAGLEQVHYENDVVERVLGKTHGVPIFQEQVMRMAIELADFTPGEADALRKAMGAWRRDGDLTHFQRRLKDGMTRNGLSESFADQIFQQITGFGEYGFPESHATSFALLAYATSYLKCHYPGVYLAGILNSLPMGFYGPAQLIRDAQSHGVTVLPIDVNASDWECTLEGPTSVRMGFRLLKGIPESVVQQIEDERRNGPFSTFEDFLRRLPLDQGNLKLLAIGDCFASLGVDRRQAIWRSLAGAVDHRKHPLLADQDLEEDLASLQPIPEPMQVIQDYQRTGLSLKGHPVEFHRARLNTMAVQPCAELACLAHKTPIKLAGIVVMRQRPGTAKGITFVTLEDESGQANLIIHPATWKEHFQVCRCSPAWVVSGHLQREGKVIHVIVKSVDDFSQILMGHRTRSRDFH